MNTTKEKKRIGQGSFSTVYEETKNTVLIVSCDPVKECMAMGWFPDSLLFPKIERVDFDDTRSIYRMKRFDRPNSLKSSLKAKHWKLYKILRDHFGSTYAPSKLKDSIDALRDHFQTVLKGKEFAREKKILLEAVDALASYGTDMWFEISPRNVAVSNGRLILLDCFFMREKLLEVRKTKRLTF